MKKLQTERLLLRPWRISDAESLYYYARDKRVGPIAGWPAHKSVAESTEIIQTIFMRDEVYAVTLLDDDKAIGLIGFSYWIGTPFWGKGLIPEAVKALICHSFETLQLDNLWCGYFADNVNSKRVQEKCGFKYHHIIKDQYVEYLDEIRTEVICRLTKSEWQKQQ